MHRMTISKDLIATHLYGSYYISFENSLSFIKLIPERVYTICSITLKRCWNFTSPLGIFDYISASMKYVQIGIRQEIVMSDMSILV